MAKIQQPEEERSEFKARAIFGFDGQVLFGLKPHPNGIHTVIPLGDKIVITNRITNKQEFLVGHTNMVSCLHVSTSGKYIASGQVNHVGFQAYVILWDFEQRKEIARHDLHKVLCESVRFSAQDKYVVSIGGVYDGYVIVLDVAMKTPICRAVAVNSTSGNPTNIRMFRTNPSLFIVAGVHYLRFWTIEKERRKLSVQEVQVGRHQRQYTSMIIDENDKNLYIGTMTGDAAHIQFGYEEKGITATLVGLYARHNPRRPIGKDCDKYANGIRDMLFAGEDYLLIGAGDGTIELVQFRTESFKNYPNPTWPKFKAIKTTKVNGIITSLSRVSKNSCLIGTSLCEIYHLNTDTFELKLKVTCHKEAINELIFPINLSTVFASAGFESIRIWSMKRLKELLRIMVHNFRCMSIVFTHDGTALVSGWNDGTIRSFTPISGKLIYAIPNAHNKGCSAVAMSRNNKTLVSAGIEGQVRIWKIEPFRQSLIAVLKDHAGEISSLHFNVFDTEVISAGTDGSCVIWDICRKARKEVIRSNTQFTCARFLPDGTQILTSGSDGRLGYWMVFNGNLLREVEAANREPVNWVAFNPTGEYFITVATDQTIKLWDYANGTVLCSGVHASPVTSCIFSPCGKFCISGSSSGATVIWELPKKYWPKTEPTAQAKENEETTKVTKNPRNVKKQSKENISGLEASRKQKELLCAECPPVDSKASPDVHEACFVSSDVK